MSELESSITPEVAKSFLDVARRQQAVWQEDPQPYRSEAGTHRAFDEFSHNFLTRMRGDEELDAFFERISSDAGFAVTAQFLYIGGAKAALNGYNLQETRAAMYNHNSFNNLTLFTRERQKVTRRLESAYGLIFNYYHEPEDELELYSISTEDGLALEDYQHRRDRTRMEVYMKEYREGNEDYIDPASVRNKSENPVFCQGHTAGILAVTYRTMLMISLDDPHLYPATLRRFQSDAAEAAS